jgi:hypothetical protein
VTPIDAQPLPRPKPIMIVTSGKTAAASVDTPTAWAKPEAPAAGEDSDGYNPGPSSPDDYDLGP